MRIRRYFLTLALLFIVHMQTNPVAAIGIRTSSSGCKKFSDAQRPYTSLKAEDNGKEVVVETGLSFDKDDQLILSWEAKDNQGNVLKSTGTLVLKDGVIDPAAQSRGNVYSFKVNTTTDVKIKITVDDPTKLGSIRYKIICYSAYAQELDRSQPAIWP